MPPSFSDRLSNNVKPLLRTAIPVEEAFMQNNFTPEGALRCRAVASGLSWTGRQS